MIRLASRCCARALPAGVALACVACAPRPSFTGVDVSSGQSLRLVPGRIAPGHSFSGVYSSPQSGKLYLTQRQAQVEGHYAYRVCGCLVQGRVWGTAEGNLASLDFQERFVGCADGRALAGRGYLFYQAVALSGKPANLFGSRAYLVEEKIPPSAVFMAERGRTAWTAVEIEPLAQSPSDDDAAHCP